VILNRTVFQKLVLFLPVDVQEGIYLVGTRDGFEPFRSQYTWALKWALSFT